MRWLGLSAGASLSLVIGMKFPMAYALEVLLGFGLSMLGYLLGSIADGRRYD